MTHEEQLQRWLDGESIHLDGSCTPDFSCCEPELLATPEVRQAFVAGSDVERVKLLGHFLHAGLARAAGGVPIVVKVLGDSDPT